MNHLNLQSNKVIDEIVMRHQGRPGPIKLMLHDVQSELGYVPFQAMEKIADAAGVSVAEVYGVVTFYSQFTIAPKGKHVINICMGTACYVKGAQDLVNRIAEMTGCEVNGTSKDGMFSLDATRCLGACGLAPVATIDGRVYGNANESTALEDFVNSVVMQKSA